MRSLSKNELLSISAARVSISGGLYSNEGQMCCSDGFYMIVTDESCSNLYGIRFYVDRVVNSETNEVLFDGTQQQFCIENAIFGVEPYEGAQGDKGSLYRYLGQAS